MALTTWRYVVHEPKYAASSFDGTSSLGTPVKTAGYGDSLRVQVQLERRRRRIDSET